MKELIAVLKASPGKYSYGSSGNGTSAHLGAAMFAQRAGIQVTHVPYRGAGPAVQDLWMLLSGDRQQQQRQLGALLDGYETMREFDRRELALIEPLRTLRLLHYSAWLARRWSDPIFPINFPWFGSAAYWQEQAAILWQQVEAMQQAPLVA